MHVTTSVLKMENSDEVRVEIQMLRTPALQGLSGGVEKSFQNTNTTKQTCSDCENSSHVSPKTLNKERILFKLNTDFILYTRK